jgi:hypothetical protein
MIVQQHDVHAKTVQGGGQAMLGDHVGLHGLEEVLKDPARLARLQATRPSSPWANQSEAEHDADVAGAWRGRTTANRRILQGVEEDDDGMIMHLLPGPTAWCDDLLATNVGDGGHCAYDCQMLQHHYFQGEESRCFLYDTSTLSWPQALLSRKQAWSDSNNTIVVPNNENWIIQGALGPDGLPVKLDARLSSGSAIDFSEASIIVRHVRFSGKIAPHDQHRVARDYSYIDDPFGSGCTLGGAFSYDGGGLQQGVRTPQLIFEHVVFDRNRAVVGAGISIIGRQGTMSGIKLVVDGCLFFRNAANFHSSILVLNSCPSRLLVNNTDFIHNDNFCVGGVWMGELDTKVGVVGQTHSWTVANTHVEGPGWMYAGTGPLFGLHLVYTPDGTIHNALMERVTVLDVQGAINVNAIGCLTTGARPINCWIRECHVASATGADSTLDSQLTAHSQVVKIEGTNYSEILHLTIEDSGAFQDESRGEGVLTFTDEVVILPEYESTHEYHVLDSTFVRNKATRGAAIGWFSSKARLVVQRCLFEVGYGSPCARSVHTIMRMFFMCAVLQLPVLAHLNVLFGYDRMQGNVATVGGGAIYIVGVTTYSVFDSIFLCNAAVPASWATTASYALRIFTGAMGARSPRGLMWSVDDGPVFGLSAADCKTAQNSSARGVERGLTPSWPGAAPCASDSSSYEPLNLYTHTLKLEEGDHVLHIGAMAHAADAIKSWSGGAWIDAGGLLDPTFPQFDDDRTALRYPDCFPAVGFITSCPGGEAFWTEAPLRVAVGQV